VAEQPAYLGGASWLAATMPPRPQGLQISALERLFARDTADFRVEHRHRPCATTVHGEQVNSSRTLLLRCAIAVPRARVEQALAALIDMRRVAWSTACQ
jgi:hypothetical protein